MGRITLSGEVENHLPRQCAQHVAERLILMAGSGIRKLNAVTSSEPLSFANLVWKNSHSPDELCCGVHHQGNKVGNYSLESERYINLSC